MLSYLLFNTFISFAEAIPPRTDPNNVFDELEGQHTLVFKDAVTGRPIANATISLSGQTVQTDANGKAQLKLEEGVGEQKLQGHFSKNGYVSTKFTVTMMSGSIWFNQFSMSPRLNPTQLRVVLDWSDSPADLDAHLVKKNGYHISYRNTREVEDTAKLDRDDTDGWGAETITLQRLDEGATYVYWVHNYTDKNQPRSSSLSQSKAHVKVYTDQGLLHETTVTPEQIGTAWKVFSFHNGEFTPINELSSTQ